MEDGFPGRGSLPGAPALIPVASFTISLPRRQNLGGCGTKQNEVGYTLKAVPCHACLAKQPNSPYSVVSVYLPHTVPESIQYLPSGSTHRSGSATYMRRPCLVL